MCGSTFAYEVSDFLHALYSVVMQAEHKHMENKNSADYREAVPAKELFASLIQNNV